MLLVAVEGDQPVVGVGLGKLKSVDQALPVAAIDLVVDLVDRRFGPQQFGRRVGRPVVDHQDLAGVPLDLVEHRLERAGFVEHGDGRQVSHGYLSASGRRTRVAWDPPAGPLPAGLS